jgi:hypothetical protein
MSILCSNPAVATNLKINEKENSGRKQWSTYISRDMDRIQNDASKIPSLPRERHYPAAV